MSGKDAAILRHCKANVSPSNVPPELCSDLPKHLTAQKWVIVEASPGERSLECYRVLDQGIKILLLGHRTQNLRPPGRSQEEPRGLRKRLVWERGVIGTCVLPCAGGEGQEGDLSCSGDADPAFPSRHVSLCPEAFPVLKNRDRIDFQHGACLK